MSYLLDSNCFLKTIRRAGETVCYTPQVISEFWNVCTRPASARGGLGLSVKETERKVRLIEKHFRLLPDNLATFLRWRQLISDLDVKGVQVHDARIATSMIVHNISHLITFNTRDFHRFDQITVIDPAQI